MAKKKIEDKKPIEQYEHTHEERLNNSPVAPGRAVAVKIIDARGIESLKIIRLQNLNHKGMKGIKEKTFIPFIPLW